MKKINSKSSVNPLSLSTNRVNNQKIQTKTGGESRNEILVSSSTKQTSLNPTMKIEEDPKFNTFMKNDELFNEADEDCVEITKESVITSEKDI